ncbi:transmembrane protease serine 11D-like [Anopheles darlingi]|uniref:transmembrane protease serine 11D-like n=1 Tax=Anopheles darlingi TaxID=43151 RepID=UPI0021004BA1|nr:transmembrane protease serine 11D-like [Anopheles darlingi]
MQLFAGLILLIAVICASASENEQNRNPRIVNGVNAQQTPYNAYVLYLNSANAGFFGGGSLISDRHVLTAAQNIQGFSRWEIGLGSTVFGQLVVQVSTQAITHPSFNSQNRANDIGVVILPSPIIFSAAIAAIALPQLNRQMPMENEEGMVVGFGFNTANGQTRSDFLKAAYQRVIGDNRCSGTYQVQIPNHFCAEDTVQRANVCNGDLGAGFTIQDRRIETLVGVASLITASCDSLTPTGYTRVSVYRQWIRDTTGV